MNEGNRILTGESDRKDLSREFWDDTIERWDIGRYEMAGNPASLVERIANRVSSSVRFRMELAGKILASACVGRRLVELGCGTGRLAPALIKAGAASYTGYDTSPRAIAIARERASATKVADRVSFSASGVDQATPVDADIVFSLGLFDWITPEQIDKGVFEKFGSPDFLHSFSEIRPSFNQSVHRLYTHLVYGKRPAAQIPRYFTAESMLTIARRHSQAPVFCYRHAKLRFGTFLTTLPIDQRH